MNLFFWTVMTLGIVTGWAETIRFMRWYRRAQLLARFGIVEVEVREYSIARR